MAGILIGTAGIAQDGGGMSVIIWIIWGIILLSIVGGLILGAKTAERSDRKTGSQANLRNAREQDVIPQTGGRPVDVMAEETPPPQAIQEADGVMNRHDLTLIDGIGPGVEQVLNGAGVETYDQLAQLTPDQIRSILRKSGLGFNDPETWPDQARLAADGEWGRLKEWQKEMQ